MEIVSDDDLNVTMEETVYEACMEWMTVDNDERSQHLVEVGVWRRFYY